jgi:hypothetical protein
MREAGQEGQGILLFHDVQPVTSKALPQVLAELKARGYSVVHMKPKAEVKTLAEYDAQIEPLMKGIAAGNARPLSSVVRTVEEEPQPTAAAAKAGEPAKK